MARVRAKQLNIDSDLDFNNQKGINVTPGTSVGDIAEYQQVIDLIAASGDAAEWQDSCISIELDSGNIVGPSTGDRYLIAGTGLNDFAGQDNDIAEWNGSSWDFITPTTGTYISIDDEPDGIYFFGGSSWTKKQFELTTAGDGIAISSGELSIDLSTTSGLTLAGTSPNKTLGVGDADKGIQVNASDLEVDASEIAGDGLKQDGVNPYVLNVEPADFAGDGLEDDGSDNLRVVAETTSVAVSSSGIKAAVLKKTSGNPPATSGDDQNTNIQIGFTPAAGSTLQVNVNGIGYEVGDNDTSKDCYFSSDGTPGNVRAISAIVQNDYLVWNGLVSGFDLGISDRIDIYGVST